MNRNMIQEVEALYELNREFLLDDELEEKQHNRGVIKSEYRNDFRWNPENYLKKDQLIGLFNDL